MALPVTTTGAITTEDIFKGRFKSGIVGQVETLVDCLIFIDLNPLQAGLLEGLKDTAGIRSDIILKLETRNILVAGYSSFIALITIFQTKRPITIYWGWP